MTVEFLLTELRRRGVELAVDDDQLRYRAPRGILTAELRTVLIARKVELLAALRDGSGSQAPAAREIDYTAAYTRAGWFAHPHYAASR